MSKRAWKNEQGAYVDEVPQPQRLTAGLTAAYFTEAELRELRKLCRDAKNSGEGNEQCVRYLQAAIDRAAGKLPIRPVDGMAGVSRATEGRGS